MTIKSPLANFTTILGQVLDAAELYQDTLQVNESSTRAVLIDPILRTLGWDTGNPYMVEVEKMIEKGRVDYALYDVNREIKIIIEAKKLGTNLNEKETYLSLVKYAFASGVSDIFLTDGLIWHHFTEFSPGNHDPSNILSLKEMPHVEIAAYFVQRLDAARYWPEEKNVDQLSQNVSQLEKEINRILLDLSKSKQVDLTGEESIDNREDITPNLIKLSDIGNATRSKPSLLQLPDGTSVPVNSWTDVLSQCCSYTLEHNPNIPIPYKDAAGKKVNLIALTRPPRGVTYYEDEYQRKQIFVYTNYDSNNCIRNSLHILEQIPNDLIKSDASVVFSKQIK